LIAVGSIGWEAILRFMHPAETKGGVIAIVAGVGIVINSVSAFLFFRGKEDDLNVKGAYLHLASDAIVSAGVVVSGILILYTGYKWIDPLISLVIMCVVVYGTWGLLKESLFLTLDAVPENVDIEKITKVLLKIKGVNEVYHIHVWAMSTSKNAMTAHIIFNEGLTAEEITLIKNEIKHELEHLSIDHVTLETDLKNYDENC
jgi:cobalt-zinc-cadmium efflux system protein